jgi:ABC-type transport system involved in multi-copper enzyme maturation permease subunit
MRAVMAIARKELMSYFFAPMAYIVIAAFLLMNGFIFAVILAALSQPGAFSAQPMLLFFGGTTFF